MSDTASVNQTYFNQIAAEYDQRYEKTLGQLERELRQSKEFIGVEPGSRMLDYACGTGLLSRALGPDLNQSVGIDVSESMVEYYNAKAKAESLYPNRRQAHAGDLLVPGAPSPDAFAGPTFAGFDLAGVGAGFHHFDDRDLAAGRLAQRLRPGGVLFVIDFLPHAVDEAAMSRGVRVAGFAEDTVRAIFEGAGVGGGFAFREMETIMVLHGHDHGHGGEAGDDTNKRERRLFIARGTKV